MKEKEIGKKKREKKKELTTELHHKLHWEHWMQEDHLDNSNSTHCMYFISLTVKTTHSKYGSTAPNTPLKTRDVRLIRHTLHRQISIEIVIGWKCYDCVASDRLPVCHVLWQNLRKKVWAQSTPSSADKRTSGTDGRRGTKHLKWRCSQHLQKLRRNGNCKKSMLSWPEHLPPKLLKEKQTPQPWFLLYSCCRSMS